MVRHSPFIGLTLQVGIEEPATFLGDNNDDIQLLLAIGTDAPRRPHGMNFKPGEPELVAPDAATGVREQGQARGLGSPGMITQFSTQFPKPVVQSGRRLLLTI